MNPCEDCVYNFYRGSMAECAMDQYFHEKETCRFYLKDEKPMGYEEGSK